MRFQIGTAVVTTKDFLNGDASEYSSCAAFPPASPPRLLPPHGKPLTSTHPAATEWDDTVTLKLDPADVKKTSIMLAITLLDASAAPDDP